jgi:hypothetical protein
MKQWGMNNMTKKQLSLLSLAGAAALGLSACGGGGSSSSGVTVSGSASDGPAVSGAAITFYQIAATGADDASTSIDTSTVTSDTGGYSEPNVGVSAGLIKLFASGTFAAAVDCLASSSCSTNTTNFTEAVVYSDGTSDITLYANALTIAAAAMLDGTDSAALVTANALAKDWAGIADATGDPTDYDMGDTSQTIPTAAIGLVLYKIAVFTTNLYETYLNVSGLSTTYSNPADFFKSAAMDIKEGNKIGTRAAAAANISVDTIYNNYNSRWSQLADPSNLNSGFKGASNFPSTTQDLSDIFSMKGISCGTGTSGLATGENQVSWTSPGGVFDDSTFDASGNTSSLSVWLNDTSSDQVMMLCSLQAYTNDATSDQGGSGWSASGASADTLTGPLSIFVADENGGSTEVKATIDTVSLTFGDATTDTTAIGTYGISYPESVSSASVPTTASVVVSYTDASGSSGSATYSNSGGAFSDIFDASGSSWNGGSEDIGFKVKVGKLLRILSGTSYLNASSFSMMDSDATLDVVVGIGLGLGYANASADATGSGLINLLPTNASTDSNRALYFNDLRIGH